MSNVLRLPRLFRILFLLPLVALLAGSVSPISAAALQKFAESFPLSEPRIPAAVRAPGSGPRWIGTPTEPGPVPELRELAREKSGALWLASRQGAARFDAQAQHPWDRWQYFHGRRWLADNEVENIVVLPRKGEGEGWEVWIRTRTGATRLEWRPMSLEEKARYFEDRIEARHVRHGMVADSRLRIAGDRSTTMPADNDNDGLWTAIHLGAQCYRYAVTQDPAARERARRSVRLLIRLEEITGVPGFPARSFVKVGQPHDSGEWHPTRDGQWLWKGDTSSDELVGHYFGYALYHDLVADPAEKKEVSRVVSRLTDHLIRHDYDLIDLDGKPTRWGQWSERYFKTEEGTYEAPLRALELLAFLKVAHHLTGESRFAAAYQERLARGYGRKMQDYRRWPGGGEINFSDDELAYLSYDPLLRYEKDPALRALYLDGLRFTWSQVRDNFNPLWNYISVASGAGPLTAAVREESRRTLDRIPMDQIKWSVRNSHRLDVTPEAGSDRFRRGQIKQVLAPDERPVEKWNSNPFIPDGGHGGLSEDDGGYYLLPYWMGRHLRAVE